MSEENYSTINYPYNHILERTSKNGDVVNINGTEVSAYSDAENSSPSSQSSKKVTGDQLDDMWIKTKIRSNNYKPGVSGFSIDGITGDVEFGNGKFRGDITGATGTFSGTISAGAINIPDATTANSFHVDSSGNTWWGATTIGSSTAKILNTGAATFTNVTITGGTIGGATVTNVGYVSTTTADSTPANLSCSSTGINMGSDGSQSAYVVLTWDAVSSNTFDHYVLRYKKDIFTYYTYLDSTTNTITIEGLTPNISYNFGVASVNKYGTQSSFSTDIVQLTASDTTVPATVTLVSATPGIQYIVTEWQSNTESDLSHYNVYRSTTNDSSTAALVNSTNANYFLDGDKVAGTDYFYWIKAVDTSGNKSDSFSAGAQATPRNVTSDDIVTLAGSKVLIDGVVYLSNWRHSSDLTKIDGGDIYAASVTTTQLNFTPVQSTNVIASINASAEGITIDADNITISGSTTFAAGYNPTTKTAAVGGTYDSAASGARVRIFPDANTGIQIIDDASNDVFKAIVGGTNVGDVTIGNYAGGQGLFYDKSVGTLTYTGAMSVAYLIAGSISSKAISLAVVDGSGDSYIAAGKTDFTNTEPGFILGIDDSDSDKTKLYIGDSINYFNWDSVDLTITAITRGIIKKTAGIDLTSNQAVIIYTDGKVYSSDANIASMTNTFLGICLATTAKDASAPIFVTGIYDNFSSLSVGVNYYLTDATYNIDQQQTIMNTANQLYVIEVRYQSFTVGTGITHIVKCSFNMNGISENTVTMKIRSGEGIGGALLVTKTFTDISGVQGWYECVLDYPLPVTAGQQYSITLTGAATINWYDAAGDPYIGGRNDIGANNDYAFKTYYTTNRGSIGTSAGMVSKKIGLSLLSTELLILNT